MSKVSETIYAVMAFIAVAESVTATVVSTWDAALATFLVAQACFLLLLSLWVKSDSEVE